MVTELRWILLGLSVVLLIGIWWWGAWRAKQSPKNTQWREAVAATHDAPTVAPALHADDVQLRDWGVPPFEPLSIRTDDFDQVELIDIPMMTASDPRDVASDAVAPEEVPHADDTVLLNMATADTASAETAPAEASPAEVTPAVAAPAEAAPQRIVTLRVSALSDGRWTGADLLHALDTQGMAYGRYKVFHRKHTDGRTLFCAASLVEPGTFDIDKMPHDEFRGLTLFAVLPGPADSLYTIDSLINTAGDLAESLHGEVQDSNGAPLSPQRAEALREEVARY